MRTILASLLVAVLSVQASGGNASARARAALALASATPEKTTSLPTYGDACKEATAWNKVLVVFVGHKPANDLYNCTIGQTNSLPGYPAQCVVVAYPKDGTVYWQATLPMGSTPQKIAEHVGYAGLAMRKAVAVPTADPFRFVQQPRGSTYCPT